jgi:hypothetical protein
VAVAVFFAANTWRAVVLGDNVLAYVAVYGGAGFCIWRYVSTNALIREFNRQWAYYQRDAAHAAEQEPAAEVATSQQPTGLSGEERGI